jgi:hypothetical protein
MQAFSGWVCGGWSSEPPHKQRLPREFEAEPRNLRDSAAVQNHAEVAVTLVITPKSTPHGSAQTWTMVLAGETATLAVDSNGNFTGSGWYILDTENNSYPLSITDGYPAPSSGMSAIEPTNGLAFGRGPCEIRRPSKVPR